jgi:hypothetical protein
LWKERLLTLPPRGSQSIRHTRSSALGRDSFGKKGIQRRERKERRETCAPSIRFLGDLGVEKFLRGRRTMSAPSCPSNRVKSK